MGSRNLEIISAQTRADFSAASRLGAYQIVTGEGALEILTSLGREEQLLCFKRCTCAHSFGPDSASVEDYLDEISDADAGDGDGFFVTISDTSSAELIWTILPETYAASRLIALSTKADFADDVKSWFVQAELEIAEEHLNDPRS